MTKRIAILAFSFLSLSCLKQQIIKTTPTSESVPAYYAFCGIGVEAIQIKQQENLTQLTIVNLSFMETVRVWVYEDQNGLIKEPPLYGTSLLPNAKETIQERRFPLNTWFWIEIQKENYNTCAAKFLLENTSR